MSPRALACAFAEGFSAEGRSFMAAKLRPCRVMAAAAGGPALGAIVRLGVGVLES